MYREDFNSDWFDSWEEQEEFEMYWEEVESSITPIKLCFYLDGELFESYFLDFVAAGYPNYYDDKIDIGLFRTDTIIVEEILNAHWVTFEMENNMYESIYGKLYMSYLRKEDLISAHHWLQDDIIRVEIPYWFDTGLISTGVMSLL